MNGICLYRSGMLKKKEFFLVLETKDGDILIPVEQTDVIFCFGEITINTKLLQLLNKYGIRVLFFKYYGNCIDRDSPKHYKSGKIPEKQVEVLQDTHERLNLAKTIQRSTLHNILIY